jgi:hypothetical protein
VPIEREEVGAAVDVLAVLSPGVGEEERQAALRLLAPVEQVERAVVGGAGLASRLPELEHFPDPGTRLLHGSFRVGDVGRVAEEREQHIVLRHPLGRGTEPERNEKLRARSRRPAVKKERNRIVVRLVGAVFVEIEEGEKEEDLLGGFDIARMKKERREESRGTAVGVRRRREEVEDVQYLGVVDGPQVVLIEREDFGPERSVRVRGRRIDRGTGGGGRRRWGHLREAPLARWLPRAAPRREHTR